MAKSLDAAVRAYHQATAGVGTAEQGVIDAKVRREKAREELAESIVAAALGGMRQRDIVKVTGYTRERVRQICRAAGIEP